MASGADRWVINDRNNFINILYHRPMVMIISKRKRKQRLLLKCLKRQAFYLVN